MEDTASIRNYLEMHPSGRNEGPTVVVVVDKSSELPLFDGGGQSMDCNEQVSGNEVAIKKARERLVNNDVIVEEFGEERQPLGKWWKNYLWPQHDEECTNEAIFEDLLSWNEAISHNMGKFMGNIRNLL